MRRGSMKTIETLPKLLLFLLFAATALYLPAGASAQICAGSSLRYVVRDGAGKVIDPTGIYETETRSAVDELKEAQKLLKGIAGNSISVVHARGMCNFREPVQMVLKLKGKEMTLIFLMPRFGEYDSRSFLVDSIPFRQGKFSIDLAGEGEANPAGDWLGTFFPAKGWKKVVALKQVII
jgi:hypothetical protein